VNKQATQFLKDSQRVSFDLVHRQKIRFNIGKYDAAVLKGTERYADQNLAKLRAAYIKRKVLANLPELLETFEDNAKERGIEVLWAKDSDEALNYIENIVKAEKVKMVVKSKSMTTEEIDLNDHLEDLDVLPLETDLGEFIVQVAGEKPYHIVTPAMHKSKEDIDKLFHEKFDTPIGSSPEFLTQYVREYLREKFVKSELGVTGANFLIADTGGIALTENEGNAVLSASFPRVHVAIAGIEKVVPSLKDLGLFWPLLSSLGTGQQVTVYNTVFSAAKKPIEGDGPHKMYIILLDNGRSDLYGKKTMYEALSCIRCGACLNACPIYKNIGGYTYASTYSGPIGSLITPHYKGIEQFKHLSFASSLCGKCGEVCPVKIPIPELLLENRRLSVEMNLVSSKESFIAKVSTFVLLKRWIINLVKGNFKKIGFKIVSKNVAGTMKSLELKETSSFSQQWKDKKRK
jgi:L-lactate dehydrogenase complex protein LldF